MEPEDSIPHSLVPATFPYPKPDQSSPFPPNPTFWRAVLILSSHLSLGLPKSSLRFPNQTLYTPLLPPYMLHALAISLFLNWSCEYNLVTSNILLSSSLCSRLHSPITLSPLGPNILLSTPFSNTLSRRSYLNVSDQVLHPYKTKQT
jgi:hypothetical protein